MRNYKKIQKLGNELKLGERFLCLILVKFFFWGGFLMRVAEILPIGP